eukprot:TRINITY_DN1858_c1_g1_i1.p1 TRINITY_DN1858_c1_g1~~TRINITY_DN1858_c1_g1_i1.p1  ORF type:complete len:616 (+),score=239.25 TRINITY_DN1858_c1_g1_i1:223-1848(+)
MALRAQRRLQGSSAEAQIAGLMQDNAALRSRVDDLQIEMAALREATNQLVEKEARTRRAQRASPDSAATDSLAERLNKMDEEHQLTANIQFFSGKEVYRLNLGEIVERCRNALQSDGGYKTHLFLHRELPIRTARAITQVSQLPHGFSTMPSTRKVKQWLIEEFVELTQAPKPETEHTEQQFTDLLKKIHKRFQDTIITLGRGLWELKREMVRNKAKVTDWNKAWMEVNNSLAGEFPQLQGDLDRFYAGRISAGFLVRQHIAIAAAKKRKTPRKNAEDYIGLVCKTTDIFQVCKEAISDATEICEEQYGDAPQVQLVRKPGDTDPVLFPHVPAHLHYIIFELLKNSLRATVELHGKGQHKGGGQVDCSQMPPIEVVVADSLATDDIEDVSVRISDRGGGIPRSHMDRVMSYMYTTASVSQFDLMQDNEDTDPQQESPLAGFGYGLPISRLYARHFGGDLRLLSMEGYGTDAYLHLGRTLASTFENQRAQEQAESRIERHLKALSGSSYESQWLSPRHTALEHAGDGEHKRPRSSVYPDWWK